MFVANKPMVQNTMFASFSNSQFQTFKTNMVEVDNNDPVWKATFKTRINDPTMDVLSILMKNQQQFCCPIIGVCAINLKNLIDTPGVDQWYPLHKGQFQTGHIRLQMLLEKTKQPTISPRAQVNQAGYSPAEQCTQPSRAQSLDEGYRRQKEEKRRLREMKRLVRYQRQFHEEEKQAAKKSNKTIITTSKQVATKLKHSTGNSFTTWVKAELRGITKKNLKYAEREVRVSNHYAAMGLAKAFAVSSPATIKSIKEIKHLGS